MLILNDLESKPSFLRQHKALKDSCSFHNAKAKAKALKVFKTVKK
jgi:hypothetical protein